MKKFPFLFFLLLMAALNYAQDSSYSEELEEHRENYKKGFLKDPRAPLKEAELPFLRFFQADETYKVRCTFTRTPDEKPFDLPTYSGITRLYVKYGFLTFELHGEVQHLSVYKNLTLRQPEYNNHLFLPFRDLTNGEETYGGGRYMDLRVDQVEAEEVWLDFNLCYNPWCCYSDGYNCPIPPTENHLEVEIRAGEKQYAGEHIKK